VTSRPPVSAAAPATAGTPATAAAPAREVAASSHPVAGVTAPAHADRIVDPRGRAKAYRPLAPADRDAALARGLAAYASGDFYLAHEELEPAWMAAGDTGDRERLAGLIKLAAAFVHAARGNPDGVVTNLRGSRERLARAAAADAGGGLDLVALLAAIDALLVRVAALPSQPAAPAGTLPDPPHDVAGPPGRAHRPPLALDPPIIGRRIRA
jgi:predicted metal-dependent hydrolase